MAHRHEHLIVEEGKPYSRWCGVCGYAHGELYVCEHYSVDTQRRIRQAAEQYRRNLCDPKWCHAQGWTPDEADVFRALAGIK